MWKALYLRMEGIAGNTTDALNAASLADATAMLYHDTIQTCFGTQDLQSEEIGLPSCVEHKLTQSYFLSNRGKCTVARILSCFAYNQPDIQYCPMLYPIASVLRHYLSGKYRIDFNMTPLLNRIQPFKNYNTTLSKVKNQMNFELIPQNTHFQK